MIKLQKVLLTGKTHTTVSRGGGTSRSDGDRVNIKLSSPNDANSVYAFAAVASHPTAEQLFAGAWSACYMASIRLVAKEKEMILPTDLAIDLEVDLGMVGDAYLLQARLNVILPGMERDVAQALAHAADEICPYSKATRGNIDVNLNVVTV